MASNDVNQRRNEVREEDIEFLYHVATTRTAEIDVCKCKHPQQGNKKVIRKKMLSGNFQRHRRQLESETEILFRVNNQNIPKIFGFIHSVNCFALILEYYPYGSYENFFMNSNCEEQRRSAEHSNLFPLKLRIIKEIIRGMRYLHNFDPSKVILHLDLKGANVLLDEQLHVKITDFGSSIMKTIKTLSSQSTTLLGTEDSKHGTMIYMCPMRLKNVDHKPSIKTDVYSFGILAWQVASDCIPYQGKCNDDTDLILRHVTEQNLRPDLSLIPDCYPHQFIGEIIESSWSQEENARPDFPCLGDRIEKIIEEAFPLGFSQKSDESEKYARDFILNQDFRFQQQNREQNQTAKFRHLLPENITMGNVLTLTSFLILMASYFSANIRGELTHLNMCPDEPLANGRTECNNGNIVGSQCSYSCDDGYALQGPSRRQCQGNGEWSARLPKCVNTCHPIEPPEYGELKCTNGYIAESTCTVECLQNHKVQGQNKLTCKDDGTWSDVMPTCVCDHCRLGDHCELSNSWEEFKRGIKSHGDTTRLTFAGHPIVCDTKGRLRGFEWKWKCHCWDERTGYRIECSHYQSRFGSCEHTSAELIRNLVQQRVYPVPCDVPAMKTGC